MTSFLRSLCSAVTLLAAGTAAAQTTVDSVLTGQGYRDQVYYSLDHGVAATAPLAGWDIAFELIGFSSSIMTNGGAGVELYLVPNRTADEWSAPVDTSGMAAGWDSFHNSTESWRLGAFNMGRDYNTGDFGWGAYNMVTHTVTGTALYVIKTPATGARKIKVDGLSSGKYIFRFANLDGTGEVIDTITKSDYVGKRFAYYSIGERKKSSPEPNTDAWDLVFGKYVAMVGPGLDMPYGVSGILANDGVKIAEVKSTTPTSEPVPPTSAFTDSIGRIGYDWKTFSGGTYVVDPGLVFFVQSHQGNMFRLRFSGFGGSATGSYLFERTQLDAASVGRADGGTAATIALHPNDLSRGEQAALVYALPAGAGHASAEVYDGRGQLRGRIALRTDAGLHSEPLRLDLSSGVYFVTVTIDGASSMRKLIVR